jgi:hypothetical protein
MSNSPELPSLSELFSLFEPEPSSEERRARRAQMYQDSASDLNAFSNWFPAVVAENIRHPATLTISLDQEFQDKILDGTHPEGEYLEQAQKLAAQIEAFGQQHGFPLFIKSSFTSAKQYWNASCFLADANPTALLDNLYEILHFQACCSPHRYAPELVVREMIPTDAKFWAFGNMPVTEEFRVFARSGRAVGFQPYWPKKAIQDASLNNYDDLLASIATPSAKDLAYMSEASERITKRLGGYWSVDFLKDKDGQLWLIDMAEGDKSFKCEVGYKKIAPPQPDPEP